MKKLIGNLCMIIFFLLMAGGCKARTTITPLLTTTKTPTSTPTSTATPTPNPIGCCQYTMLECSVHEKDCQGLKWIPGGFCCSGMSGIVGWSECCHPGDTCDTEVGCLTPTPTKSSSTPSSSPATVTVFGDWADNELAAFHEAVEPFTSETGIEVIFERVNRGEVPAQLAAQIENGYPPDVAILPSPILLYDLAKNGKLVDIGSFLDMSQLSSDTAQTWLDLGSYEGKLYSLLYGAGLNSLVWYSPQSFAAKGYSVPTTWDEMIALSDRIVADGGTPWCLGIESGAASGWMASNWIENALLYSAGNSVYDEWINHEIPWTDATVKKAWELFGQISRNDDYIYGGINGELNISFIDSPKPLFDNPPGCYMHLQGAFAPSFFGEGKVALTDYDFFLFPSINSSLRNSALGWAIPIVMFNDTPETRALMKYLAASEPQVILAQQIPWFSPNRRVSLDVYPDDYSRKMAQIIVEADTFRFDGSDLMPQAVGQEAFYKGTLDYIRGADLEAVLSDIESVAVETHR